MTGLLDVAVPGPVAEDAVAVLQEALSNTARHAHATAVEVTLAAGAELVVAIADNGVGLPEDGRRSGLANLAERAATHGGTFRAAALPQGGTELHWRVPLRAG